MTKETHLNEISKKIAEILGLCFQSSHFHDMERRLKSAANELGIDNSISGLKHWLSKSSFNNSEINVLSAHLTVGETYFFREKGGLELLKLEIIPNLIKLRQGAEKEIRIWSAGCSSGEEPYTIAMILKEYFPELTDWDITILATDISPVAIQKALHGEYTEWSFRETDVALKNKYFLRSGKNWKILPEIKKMVTFSYLNLSRNSYPSTLTNTGEMDVIFCRNVLMYFTPEVISEVSHRLYNSISGYGWLITSQVELNDIYFSSFERVQYNRSIFYRKSANPKVEVKNQLTAFHDNLPVKHIKPYVLRGARKLVRTEQKKYVPEIKQKDNPPLKSANPVAHYRKGHYINCIESCQQMIAAGKLDNEIFGLLVKSFANSGLLEEGEEIISDIISKNRTTSEMYYIFASFLREKNDLEQSEIMLRRAIYLNHRHILSHLMLGEIFVNKNRNRLAIRHYEIAIGLLDQFNDGDEVPESEGIMAGGIKALAISRIKKL